MGYFPNGTSGEEYISAYCDRCIHDDPDGGGCAIMDLHLLYNYDQNKSGPEGEALRVVLGTLIPVSKDGLSNEQCALFREGRPEPRPADAGLTPEQVRVFWTLGRPRLACPVAAVAAHRVGHP